MKMNEDLSLLINISPTKLQSAPLVRFSINITVCYCRQPTIALSTVIFQWNLSVLRNVFSS